MAKGKLREEQDAPMDAYLHRYTAAHRRHLRKLGNGNASEGVRMLIDQSMAKFEERRRGPSDRRKKK